MSSRGTTMANALIGWQRGLHCGGQESYRRVYVPHRAQPKKYSQEAIEASLNKFLGKFCVCVCVCVCDAWSILKHMYSCECCCTVKGEALIKEGWQIV